MFVVIISVFGICWLPYHVYFIYSYHNPDIMRFPHIKNIYLGFYWLAMANCAVNPIVSSFQFTSLGQNPLNYIFRFTTGWVIGSGSTSIN